MYILYFDSKYFRFGSLLLQSIQKVEPKESVLVYGINFSEKQSFEICHKYKISITVCREAIPVEDQEVLSYHIIERKARYLLNSFGLFPDEEVFIMLDADMLVLKPLTNLRRAMTKHKFDMAAILANPDKICGGFYAFRKTNKVRRMLGEWEKFLMDGNFYFDKDQSSLALLVRRYMFKYGLKVLGVPRTYLDHLSRDESLIWSAHKSEFGNKDRRYELYTKKLSEL